MTLHLLVALALAQDPETPVEPVETVEAAPEVTPEAPQPAPEGALLLTDQDRVALTAILVPIGELTGEERRDALMAPLADPEVPPAIKAALARSLGQAFDDDASHVQIVSAAMRDKLPDKPKKKKAEPTGPTLTAEKLGSVREYQRQRLVVRQETELRGGGTSVVSSPWANPYSMTPSQVVQDPIYAVQGWGIYQGSRRLTVPEYLGVIGSDQMKEFLEQDIVRLNATSKGLYAFGGLGVAATVVGIVGMNNSQTPEQRLIFFAAAGGGVVAMLTGFIGGSVPAAKATQIESDPEYTFTPEQVQEGVDTYNEQLRSGLELSSEEVLLIEAAGAGAQVQPYIVPSSSGLGLQLGVGGSF